MTKAAPSPPSRVAVKVVLRASTSISPDCSAVKRWSALSGREVDRLGVTEHTRRDRTAVIDVEPGEFAGLVDEAEPRDCLVDPALERASLAHLGQQAATLAAAAATPSSVARPPPRLRVRRRRCCTR